MSTNEIKQLVREHLNAVNTGDIDRALSLVADDFVNHGAVPQAQGAAGYRDILAKLREAFPDMSYDVEDVIAEGDQVVCRLRVKGTNTGPLRFSVLPLEPTGKAIDTQQIAVFRVENGKLVEHWVGRDDMGVLRQLGRLPQA